MVLDHSISLGVHIIVLFLSILTTYRFTTMIDTDSNNINIVVMYLDKNNKFLDQTLYLNVDINKEFVLDIGYKLNHYTWHYDTKLLFLFIKRHEYDNKMIHESRLRQIILSHLIYPIKIKEIYK